MGRWAVQSSLAIYVQEAMAFLVEANIDAATWAQLQKISVDSRCVWRHAPQLPWHFWFARRQQWRSLSGMPTSKHTFCRT
eukprot:4893069-Karenia_brevis.AAC.1